MLLCNLNQLSTMSCHQFFIGGADTLSCLQSFSGKGISRLHTTHCFTYDFDFRIVYDHIHIVDYSFLNRLAFKVSQIQNIFYMNITSCSLCYYVLVSFDHFHHTASDISIPINCYFHFFSSAFPNISCFLFYINCFSYSFASTFT